MNANNNGNDWPLGGSHVIQALKAGRRNSRKNWLVLILLLFFSAYIVYGSSDELLSHYYAGEHLGMKELIVFPFPFLFLFLQFKQTYKRAKFGDTLL